MSAGNKKNSKSQNGNFSLDVIGQHKHISVNGF